MALTFSEYMLFGAAIIAILMAGSPHLRANLTAYAFQTLAIAAATAYSAITRHEDGLFYVAVAIALIKAGGIPLFLRSIIRKVGITSDTGMVIAAPLAMHISIGLLGVAYLITQGLPPVAEHSLAWTGATAAVSLVFTGLMLMLTRRVAVSEIIGFLVLENGIYTFALTQTSEMPLIVEMGVLLDVLVGVMIFGLLVFRIQKSFEHIDVTQLAELKE